MRFENLIQENFNQNVMKTESVWNGFGKIQLKRLNFKSQLK